MVLSLNFVLFAVACLFCVIPYGSALLSIGELLDIGVAFNFCVFFIALSIFGVEVVDAKFVGMSGL